MRIFREDAESADLIGREATWQEAKRPRGMSAFG